MYNNEQKERYLAGLEEAFLNAKSTFIKTEETERQLGKDISEFTKYEIEDFYINSDTAQYNALSMMHYVLRSYTAWCISNQLINDGQNHFEEISGSMLSEYTSILLLGMRIISKEFIYEGLDRIWNPRDQFIFLSVYEFGRNRAYREIMDLRIQDIDYNKKKANLSSGRVVDVSDRWIHVAEDANECTQYYDEDGNAINNYRFDEASPYIYKDLVQASKRSGDAGKTRRIAYGFERAVRQIGLGDEITADNIICSAVIRTLNDTATSKGISAKELIKDKAELQRIENQFNKTIATGFLRSYGEFLN